MPKTDCRAPSIKVLAKSAASDNLNPLGRLVSSRLTRRSHPDCRATATKPNDQPIDLAA
jgi:hypothetical protein